MLRVWWCERGSQLAELKAEAGTAEVELDDGEWPFGIDRRSSAIAAPR